MLISHVMRDKKTIMIIVQVDVLREDTNSAIFKIVTVTILFRYMCVCSWTDNIICGVM